MGLVNHPPAHSPTWDTGRRRKFLCKCPVSAGQTRGQLFLLLQHLHSSPSFKEAHVGKTLTIGRHLINGNLCDLEGMYTQFCAPVIA